MLLKIHTHALFHRFKDAYFYVQEMEKECCVLELEAHDDNSHGSIDFIT